jgi:NAD(P)-dependent dehydrogenase (short-subunit alcohol dehydrogenase family)
MREDDFYPTIGITSKAEISEAPSEGWRWVIQVHVAGPDCLAQQESPLFKTKREATADLILNHGNWVTKLFQEMEP